MIMSRRKSGSTSGGSSRLVRNPNFFQASPSSQSYARGIPQAVLSQARKTGQLNLSDKGIRDIPESLWTLNVDVPEGASLSFEGEERWWDQALLTRLNLSSNEIHQISPKIENFTSLDTLELQYNQITELPVTIGTLVNLQKLFISYNQLVSLPGEVSSLVNLRILHLNNNKLTCLPMSITQLEHLEDLNVASNELGVLPDGMACLVHLRALNLSQNKLTGLPADIGNMKELVKLNLDQNKLSSVPPLIGLEKVTEINLEQNQLTDFPLIRPGNTLKTLMLGNNRISVLNEDHFSHLSELTILILRENKLSTLPESIVKLSKLERFDLSNNDLSNLPYVMGRMDTLHSLLIEGNPLRTIRRDVINRGTVELLKYLRSKIQLDVMEDVSTPPSSPGINKISSSPYKTRSDSHVMKNEIELSKQNLAELPPEIFLLPSITSLNASFNKLITISDSIGQFDHLITLDLRKNQLKELPKSLPSCAKLRYVNISNNQFTCIPEVLYQCVHLENLFASANQIKSIDVNGLLGLKELTSLDLSNNDISQVPPLLGNVEWLRHLELGGNPFRIPRVNILSKGTASVLEYLRDRIPQ